MAEARIERAKKNQMRAQLEKILESYRQLGEQMSLYENETEVGEYVKFWQELKAGNRQSIERISRYMVMKCNR
ncbi:hypothetical protein [Syntrophomonas palmitatica]|uniref:hypothetical protein n=1 Tax=Syntrophomonas palmitatica TaxID=402877 RepID=UPI000ACDE720|nr:hypothetical protein [Syntrophomonas palmitatica]